MRVSPDGETAYVAANYPLPGIGSIDVSGRRVTDILPIDGVLWIRDFEITDDGRFFVAVGVRASW